MAPHTVGDGLFGTPVTWADVEADMMRELDTTASFGPNKSAKDIGDMKGFMSKIVLIEPDWQNVDKELPEKFIVKILTQLVMQKVNDYLTTKEERESEEDKSLMSAYEELQKRCHNGEVTAYTMMRKIPQWKITIPKIYYMQKFTDSNPSKGYIIMEYLGNTQAIPIYENISLKQVKQILHYKAVLEANLLDVPLSERKGCIEKPLQEVFSCKFLRKLFDSISTSMEVGKLSEKAAHMKTIAELADFKKGDELADRLGMEEVFCHGDLWSMNILWRPDGGEELSLAALVDYQGCTFGCPATDIVRVFCSCLSGSDRRNHWEKLLEYFYKHLQKEVGERRMPYTLDQLKESYRQYFPTGAYGIAPVVASQASIVSQEPNEELRNKRLETVMEKAESLLDDALYFHEQNQKAKTSEHPTSAK